MQKVVPKWKYALDTIIAMPLLALCLLFQTLPESKARVLGRSLGRLVWALGIRRSVIHKNLQIAFPDMQKEKENKIIRNVYINLGDFLCEWLSFPANKAGLNQRVRCFGTEHLDSAIKKGKGILICSAHIGNWELLASIGVSYSDRPLSIVRTAFDNTRMDRWFTDIHHSMGYDDILKRNSTPEIIRRLKNNEMVGMLVDQSGRSSGVWVPFFGRPTSFHRGPGVLSAKTECVIITAFCLPASDGVWEIEFSPLEVCLVGDAQKDSESVMTEYALRLESVIRAHPDRYFWFHRRWKTKMPEHLRDKWPEL